MLNGKDIMYLKHQVAKPYIRVATENDCWFLSKNLREEDYQEIKASSGLPAILSLLTGLKISQVPLVVCNEKGEIILMLGVVPSGLIGTIWMVGTKDLKNMSLTFIKNCKKTFKILKNNFQIIHNYVDARNHLHIKWLKWMGFSFIKKHNYYGIEKRPFYEFVKI
jgi:hypothetical protein